MSDITELERRITAALDQIGQGLEGLDAAAAAPDTSELDALRGELDDERTANAQLEERLRSIRAKNDKKLDALKETGRETRAAMDKLDSELGRLRAANGQLRENNSALRAANEAGVGEAHLINKAMLAELEALRATRAVDVAESTAILTAMAPLLQSAEIGEDA